MTKKLNELKLANLLLNVKGDIDIPAEVLLYSKKQIYSFSLISKLSANNKLSFENKIYFTGEEEPVTSIIKCVVQLQLDNKYCFVLAKKNPIIIINNKEDVPLNINSIFIDDYEIY